MKKKKKLRSKPMTKQFSNRNPIQPNGRFIPREIKDRNALGDNMFTITEHTEERTILTPNPIGVLEEGTVVNKDLLQPYEDFLGSLKNEDGCLQDHRGVVANENSMHRTVESKAEETVDLAQRNAQSLVNPVQTQVNNNELQLTSLDDWLRNEEQGQINKIRSEIKNEIEAVTADFHKYDDKVREDFTYQDAEIRGSIRENYDSIVKNDIRILEVTERLNNLKEGIEHLAMLQLLNRDIVLQGNQVSDIQWEVANRPTPQNIDLINNQIRVFNDFEQIVQTSFNTRLIVTASREEDVIITFGRTSNGEDLFFEEVIPQGSGYFTIERSSEIVSSDTFELSLRSSHDISIASVEVIINSRFIGEFVSSNVALSTPEQEGAIEGVTTQMGLNIQNNTRINNLENNAQRFITNNSRFSSNLTSITDWENLRGALNAFFNSQARASFPLQNTPNPTTETVRCRINSVIEGMNAIRNGLGITDTGVDDVTSQIITELQNLPRNGENVNFSNLTVDTTTNLHNTITNYLQINRNLIANTVTLGDTTINGTTTLNGQLNVNGNLSARNFRGGLNWSFHVQPITTGTHTFNAGQNLTNIYITITDRGQGTHALMMLQVPNSNTGNFVSNRLLEFRRSGSNNAPFNRHRLQVNSSYNKTTGIITVTIQNVSFRYHQTTWGATNYNDGRALELTIIGY